MSIRKAFLLILIAELIVGLLGVYNYGFNIEALQATTRFSGRLSLIIFSLIFIYLTFNREKLSAILSAKPFHMFAIAHGIHLIELISFVYLSGADLIPIRVAGGFLAYVFIFIMPFIHTRFESGKVSDKKYALSENIYLYYVWLIFFMSYLPRVQGKLPHVGGSYWEFVVLLSWVCMLMAAKILSQINLVPKKSV
jgi:hypothetical protein